MLRLQNILNTTLVLLTSFVAAAGAQVVSVSPAQNALQVSPNTSINVTFNQAMNAATINDLTFRVWGMQSGPHKGTITYNAAQREASFAPLESFAPGENVVVTLTNDIRTADAKPLAQFAWLFTISVKPSSGRFAPKMDCSVGDQPVTVVAADLDGDKDMDLAVTNYSPPTVTILKNLGNAKFAPKSSYSVGWRLWALCAADFDGDHDLDLAVTNSTDNTVSILKNNGDAAFQKTQDYAIGSFARAIIAADLDGDGDADLATANRYDNNVSILKNNGNATFQPRQDYATGGWPYAMVAVDVDKDGDLDLATANNYSHSISILKNNSDGILQAKQDYRVGEWPISLAAADLDKDGDMDLGVTRQNSNIVNMVLNNGDGTFGVKQYYSIDGPAYSACAVDLDGDGDNDIATASPRIASVLKNNGNAILQPRQSYTIGNNPLGLAAADFDGDGDLDLATANHSSHNISILINRGQFLANVSALDFSKVYLGQTKELRCKIFNYAATNVVIDNISINNARFTITSPPIAMVAAGDSAQMTVQYAPTIAMNDTGTVTISPNGLAPERIALKGIGVPPVAMISISPASLDFGNVTVNTAADMILSIANTGVVDLNITNSTHDNSNFKIIGGANHTIHPGETKLLVVSFTAPFLGSQLDTLKIFSNDALNNLLKIPMSGSGVSTLLPEIAAQPLQLAFDSIVVKQTKILALKIYNRGAANLTVSNIATNNAKFSITSPVNFTLPPGDSNTVNVKFSPVEAGLQTAMLTIANNDVNENLLAIKTSGFGKQTTAIKERVNRIPGEFRLEQNYPNPFASAAKYAETTIKYQLPKEAFVTLRVFDVLGREMIALVNAQQAPGYYNVKWNGRNAAGQLVPGGVYLCRLQAESYERVTKMMVVR